MKTKTLILTCLVLVLIFTFSHEKSVATPKATATSKIGVVNVLKVFRDCKRNETYKVQMAEEQAKIEAQLKQLEIEIVAEEAGLQVVKQGSDDYMARAKKLFEKRAYYQAQQEFYKRQIEMKYQNWTEKLYQDILAKTTEIAKKKGLELVLEQNTPELPSLSYSELMTIITTHKVLYSGGCVDISDEVMSLVNAVK